MANLVRNSYKFLTLLAILVLIGSFIYMASESGRQQHTRGMPAGSTYSNSFDGGELMYRLLEELDFNVEKFHRPLDGTYVSGEVDIIWHVGGRVGVDNDELNWLREWVGSGGKLFIVINPHVLSVERLDLSTDESADSLTSFWMDEAGTEGAQVSISRMSERQIAEQGAYRLPISGISGDWPIDGIERVVTYVKREQVISKVYRLVKSDDLEPIVDDRYGTVIGRISHGSGYVYLIADPYFFSNLLIQEEDNSAVLISLLEFGGGERGRILFDEYHLGFVQTRSITDAAKTPVGRGIIFLGLVFALYVGTLGARFGRPRKADRSAGVSQKAFVESLAGLWQAAGSTGSAVEAIYRRYRHRASVQRRGLDVELARMKSREPRIDMLLEVVKKLDD